MKLGFIGMGFVGGTTAKALEKVHEIFPYDKYKKEYQNKEILKEAETIFICVPTPPKLRGEIDLSAIYDSVKILSEITKDNKTKPLVVIRSTVIPGTTNKLEEEYPFNFVSNPEFLRQKHALDDMLNTNRIIIGANREKDYKKVESIYKPVFPDASYICVDRKTAEMIKYASNAMLVGQIALANEIYQICDASGVNYNDVKTTLLMDNRIARNIDVPGPDGDFGFGGKCFPKDLNALIYLAREHTYRSYLFEEIWRLNEKVRKNKDWLKIPRATSENNYKKNSAEI